MSGISLFHPIDLFICSMTEEIRPIKRSEQLAPLSREHHEGLLFAWKIRQGIANRTSLDIMKKYVLWYWKHHIKPHFFQEEKILVPAMPEDHPLVVKMLEDHDNIRELILGLDDEADTITLGMLSSLLNSHIRFEERKLFTYLELTLAAEQLNAIYQQLEKHPVNFAEEWKDEFWGKK